ncbi:hypothetical protein ATANTOWER_019464 [Ataeniobius toweri]|uniref:Uncharacterized protein n=1 Tax=Ataeniobius toweri TaxID=208326 RepID=A0ABU7A7I3_9TELE|nr:hypothetical protein [Ataeniobius toweri]
MGIWMTAVEANHHQLRKSSSSVRYIKVRLNGVQERKHFLTYGVEIPEGNIAAIQDIYTNLVCLMGSNKKGQPQPTTYIK